MIACDHSPSMPIGRIEDLILGQRYVGRDENYDKKFDDIICGKCGVVIHLPGSSLKELGKEWKERK